MNDWINLIERFDTFGRYPFETLVHICMGVWCGRELTLARVDKALAAAVVWLGWIAYQLSEMALNLHAGKHDDADVDIANGLAGIFIGITLTTLYHRYRRKS